MLPLRHATVRAALSVASLSAWLVLLFSGFALGGAVHLLFVVSLALFPWRAALAPGPGDGPAAEAGRGPAPGEAEAAEPLEGDPS